MSDQNKSASSGWEMRPIAPCPFCGKDAKRESMTQRGAIFVTVGCPDIGCPGYSMSGYPIGERAERHLTLWNSRVEPSGSELLDQIEAMARQYCFTARNTRTYHGVPEINVTDSGALSADADALLTLAKHGRFRVVRECGDMVVGYWPENDPENKESDDGRQERDQTGDGGD